MVVNVHETLKGNLRAKRITIIGDFGASCIPYVTRFPLETEWVFAVIGPVEVAGLGDENFVPRACAQFFLQVEGDRVTGNLEGWSREELSLEELRKRLHDSSSDLPKRPTSNV